MPIVFVKLNEGKSENQKKVMAEGIIQTIVNVTNLDRSMVYVGFEEYSALNSFGDLIIALVHTIEGKTTDDKRQMAQGIANAIVDGAEIDISLTRVGFRDYPKDSYASAGVLLSDK